MPVSYQSSLSVDGDHKSFVSLGSTCHAKAIDHKAKNCLV